MKRVFGLLLVTGVLLASCSRKTQPTVSTPVKKQDKPAVITTLPPPVTEPPPTVAIDSVEETPAATAAFAPMIVIDEKGKVITSRDKLPEEVASKVNYPKISRGYTPAQRQNLIFRFKMVPPRVLFVPDNLATKNAKGTYVIYRKIFWYWKKEDGLFHIDETYYL
jgi:hypothetical protein